MIGQKELEKSFKVNIMFRLCLKRESTDGNKQSIACKCVVTTSCEDVWVYFAILALLRFIPEESILC